MKTTYGESEQQRWFTDTGVSNKEHLEEIVAIDEDESNYDMVGKGTTVIKEPSLTIRGSYF